MSYVYSGKKKEGGVEVDDLSKLSNLSDLNEIEIYRDHKPLQLWTRKGELWGLEGAWGSLGGSDPTWVEGGNRGTLRNDEDCLKIIREKFLGTPGV